jgi:hypothetical protein
MARRLAAWLLITGVVLAPSAAEAGAGGCWVEIDPHEGWRGATITIEGNGWAPGVGFYVQLNGELIRQSMMDASGEFSFEYTIPEAFPVGGATFYIQDFGTTCDFQIPYWVAAGPPPPPPTTTTSTTASTSTTSTSTTSTTVAPTTTAAPSTTLGPSTTPAPDVTTTSVPTGSRGTSPVLWVALGLLGLALFAAGWWVGRRSGTASPPSAPPPMPE